ncbi:putative MFS general substrate transporter [Lyophyllum shimeji]|uniref:MFS general substrate transporter n=1 Tax=Lyophyllum shimeji TaxID=47721 RepID=A0A9P3PJN8_LYOSH|nr:putative MFS general substrate transporter [Lyophyllum shimeji]
MAGTGEGDPEKDCEGRNAGSATSDDGSRSDQQFIFPQPMGLKRLYFHPLTQTILLGFVCFMCPGLFNALNGLGAGGQVDSSTSANANSVLYATFAVAAFFAGSVTNKIGAKRALLLGSTGYALYIGSYLAVNIHPKAGGFVIGAGAVLGFCAGLLWTAQGSLMLAYGTETQKGLFISVFWSIFNLGAVVGASVSLGQNFHSKANSVENGTYIVFLGLTLVGVLIPLLMVDPTDMVRTDGTKVAAPRHPSWKVEIYGLWLILKTDPMILFLFPMFFTSNWFYTWQFNEYNNALFNIRARSLNNLVYWLAQIVGSLSIGFLLDQSGIPRRTRAFAGWAILLVMVFIVHTWAYFYQKEYTRESIPPDAQKMDIYDHGYTPKILLYIFCGLLDAMWQTTAYWIMGAMSNDPAKLAHFAGFYKSFQSAGGAGVWRADGAKTPFMNVFISTWTLLVAGLVFALPMIYMRVKEHTEYSDEVLARMDDSGHVRGATEVQNSRDDTKQEHRHSKAERERSESRQ